MTIFEYDENEHMMLVKEEIKQEYERGVDEGKAIGINEGKAEGIQITKLIFKLDAQGIKKSEIAKKCNMSEKEIEEILS